MQRNIAMLIAVALVAILAALALRSDILVLGADDNEAVYKGQRLLVDAMNLVRRFYVSEVDNKKLFEDAIEGMLQGLDHFSSFIPEGELDEFNKQVRGSFGGIGIVIGMEGGWLSVISPIEDGPAFKAGVMAGDKIIEIEGVTTESTTLDQAVKKLTGEPGTKVSFTVIHEADLKRDTFTVTREVIHVKTVKGISRDDQGRWQYLADKPNGIAYIRVTSFTNDTVSDLARALEEAKAEGMKSLILDLRWNGGGLLDGAVGVSDLFLDEGVIVSTRGRAEQEKKFMAHAEKTVTKAPMVVLVNDRSASASEIVAGALQDQKRAVVLGERTFGKGSVQQIFPLDSGRCAARLTVAKYYLPSGRCIHRDEGAKVWGVDPLIEVKMTPKEYAGVFVARRDSEVLRVNGKKPGSAAPGDNGQPKPEGQEKPQGQETPKSEEPKPEEMTPRTPPKPEKGAPDEGGSPREPAGGAGKAPAGDKAAEPVEDRQLTRAIDVLRMMPVLGDFVTRQPAEEKTKVADQPKGTPEMEPAESVK